MKRVSLVMLLVMLMLAACIIPNGRGGLMVVPPPLPPIVEIGPDPFYYQEGYHYQYRDNDRSWYYSHDRSGPWEPLPRDRYPKETRFKGQGEGRQGSGDGQERGPDNGPGHDQRDNH